jgi:hypothetical protein
MKINLQSKTYGFDILGFKERKRNNDSVKKTDLKG